ncbi:MAG: penicillin acylase family protein [Planctomycetes bacterium]|nr:penicillin acylase family protein [Planctomycetota bacterium]
MDPTIGSSRTRRLRRLRGLGATLVASGCVLVAVTLAGCRVLPPDPGSAPTGERLLAVPTAALPLHGAAELRWNGEQVPYLLCEDDGDVPLLLGIVHAHLRRTQMELFRRIAQGRLSELGGPLAWDVDHTLRALDIDRAVPAIEATLPAPTRAWLVRYVEGVNLQASRAVAAPPECGLLGIDVRADWTVADVLAVARLGSIDINLARFLGAQGVATAERYTEYRARMERYDRDGVVSYGPEQPTPLDFLVERSKSGSNAFVVGGARTRSGAALIASDPHLGFLLPNVWCVVAWRTPTQQVAGLTLPGVPAVVVGRNRHIAWGGTNMGAWSSSLYDVAGLPADAVSTRSETLRTRWWFDHDIELRETPYGPLISDAPLLRELGLPPLALDWRGHRPSDEITAFLRVGVATDWDSFRAAFETYATGGQNFLYADAHGHIGQLLATELVPAASRAEGALQDGSDPAGPVREPGVPGTRLPAVVDPPEGYLVSANNTPVLTEPPVSAYRNSNDRVLRIRELIEQQGTLGVADMRRIQRDVHSRSSAAAAAALLAAVDAEALSAGARALRDRLAGWDGDYAIDSVGAVAFQAVVAALLEAHYRPYWGDAIAKSLASSTALNVFLQDDVAGGAIDAAKLRSAFEAAAAAVEPATTWGDVHRVRLRHPLGFAPLIGGSYTFLEMPIAGSTTTIAKSAHAVSAESHASFYGAQARHVADLGDPDENWFLLLGGQDGWLGSANLIDQAERWNRGDMVRVPFSELAIERHFRIRQPLTGGVETAGEPRRP